MCEVVMFSRRSSHNKKWNCRTCGTAPTHDLILLKRVLRKLRGRELGVAGGREGGKERGMKKERSEGDN